MSQVVTIRGMEDVYPLLDPDLVEQARRRTLNDMCRQSSTESSSVIRQTYTVKAGEFKARVTLKLATAANGEVKITVVGRRFGLMSFTGTRAVKSGVSVKLRSDRPRSILPWAFIATMRSGHEGVFRRTWRDATVGTASTMRMGQGRAWARMGRQWRLTIKELTTVGAAQMFDQQMVYAAVQTLVDAKFETVFNRNYAYYAAKQGSPSPDGAP